MTIRAIVPTTRMQESGWAYCRQVECVENAHIDEILSELLS